MKVEQGLVNILGGFGVGFHNAASIDVSVGDGAGCYTTHTYVLLDKNAQWFLKGAGGDKVQKGDVKAVKIIDTTRAKLGRLAVLLMMCSVLQLMMCSVLQLMES